MKRQPASRSTHLRRDPASTSWFRRLSTRNDLGENNGDKHGWPNTVLLVGLGNDVR